LLVWEDDFLAVWKLGELVRIGGRRTGEGFYNGEDDAIAEIWQVSSLREH